MDKLNKTIVKEISPIKLDKYADKRAVIYTRVSSRKDATEESLITQESKLLDYINQQPNMLYVKTYSDDGITGTVEERAGFQEMINDCRSNKVDIIVTKSITRFARNTTLTLKYLRELKALGIDVYFHKEKMHSISDDGEFIITLLATFAEAESQSASENQLWRIRKDFEHGIPSPTRACGYQMLDRKFVIIPEEAKIVKRIFEEYVGGKGLNVIAKELNLENIKTINGGCWLPSVIGKMIHNEIYMGDLLLQKTYRRNYRTKCGIKNRGELRQYYVSNDHDAIIDKETFELAQKISKERKNSYSSSSVAGTRPTRLYTGIIYCGSCGEKFIYKIANGSLYLSCRTYQYMGKDKCPIAKIPEYAITEHAKEIIGKENITREDILANFGKIIIPKNRQILFITKSEEAILREWEHKSRSESWTPEMREKARMRSLARSMEV